MIPKPAAPRITGARGFDGAEGGTAGDAWVTTYSSCLGWDLMTCLATALA